MRIIVTVGITDSGLLSGKLWEYLDEVFAVQFPNVEITVEREWYWPWQFKKIRAYADRVVEKYDTGEDLILIGHSMGGVVACAAAPRFKKSHVKMVSTVFSPHEFLWRWFSRSIGSDLYESHAFPIVSFKAALDPIVWWGSRHPSAVKHILVRCDHYFLWLHFSKKPLEYIAREMRHLL